MLQANMPSKCPPSVCRNLCLPKTVATIQKAHENIVQLMKHTLV